MIESALLAALAERVLVFDGAMGTQIHAARLLDADYTLTSGHAFPTAVETASQRLGGKVLDGCCEIVSFTRPEVIESIHRRYLEAGADLIETNTFSCTSVVLGEYDVADLDYEIGKASGAIARRAADAFSSPDKPRFAVGAIGPGSKLISLGQTTWEELETTYTRTFTGLLESGVDALLLETLQDLLMAKAGIVAAHQAMALTERNVPLFIQVTIEQNGSMLLGSDIAAALNMAEAFPRIAAFGMNCATGPVEMIENVRFLGRTSTRPISIQPNAGLPEAGPEGPVYKLTPSDLATHHLRFVEENGVAMVGGCCGTTPEHIRAVAEAVGGRRHSANPHWREVRQAFPGFDFTFRGEDAMDATLLAGCSSLFQFQPYRQDASFFIVGEKTNANGSGEFRRRLAQEDWEGLTEIARELEAEGSHALDVCAAYVGRDEERDMRILLASLNRQVTVPIMIDSTEVHVIEAALQCLGGKPIVNSINFEDGEERAQRVLALCRKYGAAVVGLTIDERGMAKTAGDKIAIAERLLDRTRGAGMPDFDVFIDCLTFTLGSGVEDLRNAGVETLDAIREIRLRYPRVNAILGVSNISFGLKPAARQVLNSAFLHYALEAGLTAAIVHFSKIVPQDKVPADVWNIACDVVFDRRVFADA